MAKVVKDTNFFLHPLTVEEDNLFSLSTQVTQKNEKKLSRFQYSERTKATTETNNTSKESSELQLSGVRKTKAAWHYQEGATPTRRKKHISVFLQ